MELALPFGQQKVTFEAPFPPANLAIARRKPAAQAGDWVRLASLALESPVGENPLPRQRLAGQTVAIVVDASVPAEGVLPLLLANMEEAGARTEDIVVVATSPTGPRTAAALRRAVGDDTLKRCRCTWHDPFSSETDFHGFSALGTPLLINSHVARASFRMAVGKVQPHATLGYTGGDDLILPGTAAAETAIRSLALGFSYNSTYGRLEDNPCRLDIENAGTTIGLDYILNYVVRFDGRPVAAFAGSPIKAQRAAVNHGDRLVWGAEIGARADAAIASPGNDWPDVVAFDPRCIDLVASGVKLQGSIVYLAGKGPMPQPESELERDLWELPTAELAAMFDKRDWDEEKPAICERLDAVMRAYIARRPFYYRHVILVGSELPEPVLDRLGAEQVPTMDEAMQRLQELYGPKIRVALVPEAMTTLCLPEYH